MSRYIIIATLLLFTLLLSCSGGNDNKQVYTGVVEGTIVKVPALTGGKIDQLFFDNGDFIEEGSLLAQIDTLELSFQKDNLLGILQEVDYQRQIALTQLERANKELKYVREKYRRFEDLLQSESISQQNVDDLKNQLQNAESVYQTAQQQIRSVDAKRTQTQAQLNTVQKKILDARITAPRSGTVAEKFYETGEAIPPLAPVAEIIDLNEVWVTCGQSVGAGSPIGVVGQTGASTWPHLHFEVRLNGYTLDPLNYLP